MALARAYLVLERDGQNSIFIHRVVLFCGFLIFDQDFGPSSFSDSQSKRMVGWCSLFFGIFFLYSKLKFKWMWKRKARGKRGERMRKLQYIVMLLWCWWWALFSKLALKMYVLTSCFHCHTFFCSEEPNVVLTLNAWKILLYKIILKIKLCIHVLHFGVYNIN